MENSNEMMVQFINNASDDERISVIKSENWIGYTQAEEILERFEYLRTFPECYRMPNTLLIGESNNGKTSILHRYVNANPPYMDKVSKELVLPVLFLECPTEPSERGFYINILEALKAPYQTSERIEVRRMRIIHLIKKLKVKLIMIDEIHSILAGTINKQRAFLNLIKYLSNTLKISFVCSGTKLAANAISTDPQLMSRFPVIELKIWRKDIEFLRLLASFEKIIPLKQNVELTSESVVNKILTLTEGYIGEISDLLRHSAIYAIKSGKETIDIKVIESLNFVPPSKRRTFVYNNI